MNGLHQPLSNMQLELLKLFSRNVPENDLFDINIAKQRLTEPGMDYEEYRRTRKRS